MTKKSEEIAKPEKLSVDKEKAAPPIEDAKKAVKPTHLKESSKAANTVISNRLEMLITVIPRNKAEYYVDVIQSFEVNMQMIVHAEGTANETMLSLLGLTDSDKAVIFSIIQQNKIPKATRILDEKFKTIKGGKGIAFTIPLTSVIGKMIFGFLSNNRMTVKEGK